MLTLLLVVLVVVLLFGGIRFPDVRNIIWVVAAIVVALLLYDLLR